MMKQVVSARRSKFLAIVLSAVLVLSLIPAAAALADEATQSQESTASAAKSAKSSAKSSDEATEESTETDSEPAQDKAVSDDLGDEDLDEEDADTEEADNQPVEELSDFEAPWTKVAVKVVTPSKDGTIRDPKAKATIHMEAQYDDPEGRNALVLVLQSGNTKGDQIPLKVDKSSVKVTIGGVDVTALGYFDVEENTDEDGSIYYTVYWEVDDAELVASWAGKPIVMEYQVGLANPDAITKHTQKNMGVAGLAALATITDFDTAEIDEDSYAFAFAQGPWSIDVTPTPATPAAKVKAPAASELPPTGDAATVAAPLAATLTLMALIGAAGVFVVRRREA